LLHHATALAAAVSIQSHAFVATARWARADAGFASGWDAGLLAGIGSPFKYAVHGSVAAGVGRVQDERGQAGVTVPLELQLGWRLAPSIGTSLYAFTNLGGPADLFGLTIGIRLGRLQ
jgi:hypothetical protein